MDRKNCILLLFLLCFSARVMADETDRVERQKIYPNGKIEEKWQEKKVGDTFVKDGFYKRWYDNGNLHGEGQYKNGKRDGKWFFYYNTNKKELFDEQCYKDGVRDGENRLWKDGVIVAITYYENGKIVKILLNEGGQFRPFPIPSKYRTPVVPPEK